MMYEGAENEALAFARECIRKDIPPDMAIRTLRTAWADALEDMKRVAEHCFEHAAEWEKK